MIYNASAYEAVEDKKVRDFLHFVMTNDPEENDFCKRLSETVERLKENEKFRSDYVAMNLHDRDIIKRTQKEASEQKAVEAAINLLKMDILTPEQIAQAQGLPLEKVLELQKEIAVQA